MCLLLAGYMVCFPTQLLAANKARFVWLILC